MHEKTIERSGRLYHLKEGNSEISKRLDIDVYYYSNGKNWEDIAVYTLKGNRGAVIGVIEVSNSPHIRNGIWIKSLPRSKGLEAIAALAGRRDHVSSQIRSKIIGWPEVNSRLAELALKDVDGKA